MSYIYRLQVIGMDPLPTKLLKSLYPIMDPLVITYLRVHIDLCEEDIGVFLAGELKRSKMTCGFLAHYAMKVSGDLKKDFIVCLYNVHLYLRAVSDKLL
jgi:hypothetical protein